MRRVVRGIGIRASALLWNIYTLLSGIFIHRDDGVVLCGAWMGEKFADNPRFLFQYLHENKQKLKLKKVLWVTRNNELYKELQSLGYETILCGTKESNYWHLKAGTHILCNISYVDPKFLPDIDIRFSITAKKIQLWHGVGMKAVGGAANAGKGYQNNKLTRFKNVFQKSRKFQYIFSLGGWSEQNVLCTSQFDKEIMQRCLGTNDDRIFFSDYPRYCKCIKLTPNEEEVVEKIKASKVSIIYLPTFRDDYSHYIHPLKDKRFVDFLNSNEILWIDKQHQASTFLEEGLIQPKNCLFLNKDFDINVLFPHIDIIISDYSSVIFDGIYLDIPTVMYAPDISVFANGPVGFLFNIEEYLGDIIADNMKQCTEMVGESINDIYFTGARHDMYKALKEKFYQTKKDYPEIWKDIVAIRK